MTNIFVTRQSVSKQELREFTIPPAPILSEMIVSGQPEMRAMKIREYNTQMENWRRQIQDQLQQWLLAIKQTSP